MVNMGKKMQNN